MELVLEITSAVADKSYQIRVWINGIGPECDSYDECVNSFFYACDTVLDERKQFSLTEAQYDSLKIFKDTFWKFNKSPLGLFLEAEFIDTPEWAEVMQKAQDVVTAFNYIRKPLKS